MKDENARKSVLLTLKLTSEILQETTLAEEEFDGRDEMGITVDRLVVEMPPTAESRRESNLTWAGNRGESTCCCRLETIEACYRTREELGVFLTRPGSESVVFHYPPF